MYIVTFKKVYEFGNVFNEKSNRHFISLISH